MKKILLLGSTGSVGKNVLNVIRKYPEEFSVSGLTTYENIDLLCEQIYEFSPQFVCVGNDKAYKEIKKKQIQNIQIYSQEQDLKYIISKDNSDIVFMAISGIAALKPLIWALEQGKTVALASKEPIVSAGQIIRNIINTKKGKIIPVDSEHSAIMQCLEGREKKDVEKIYITGSGGALHNYNIEDFDKISIEKVLDHPKWDMGDKITVDSATLMNKGLEMIEARWLFDISFDKIKIIIHPEAIIHSLVEFIDGTINATMFFPDMKFPILKALSYPKILKSNFTKVDLLKIKHISFLEPDIKKFPLLQLAFEAMKQKGSMLCVLNASNEQAVKLFLKGKIKFIDIVKIVETILEKHKHIKNPKLEDIFFLQEWAQKEVLQLC